MEQNGKLPNDLNLIRWTSTHCDPEKGAAGGDIGTITIHRPEALNALNRQVLTELSALLNYVAEQSSLRCILLRGAGDRAFVAGADIREMESLSRDEAVTFSQLGQTVFSKLERLPMPVISVLQGFALGGGFELALATDLIVASETAKVGLPEVSLGLIPGFGGTQRLMRAVGIYRAREIMFSANAYSARELYNMGLISRVVPLQDLEKTVSDLVTSICKRSPVAIARAKRVTLDGSDLPLAEGLRLESSQFGQLFGGPDQKEGVAAFLAKRPANFSGRVTSLVK